MLYEEIILEKLNNLKILTDNVLLELIDKRKTIGGSAHWNDLVCEEAQFIITNEDKFKYRVIIRNADPTNGKFMHFIKEKLFEKGFYDVEVTVDW